MTIEDRQRMLEVLKHFKEGRRLYTMQKFAEARDAFARAIAIDKEDGPSRVFHARCKRYLEEPPGESWDGVWVMKEK
jgi:hypothetical protein